jgi:hypothetical protein
MKFDKLRNIVKVLLISFNVFCIGGITYNVIKGDFSNPITLQTLAIFLWLMYLSNDTLKKISN